MWSEVTPPPKKKLSICMLKNMYFAQKNMFYNISSRSEFCEFNSLF